MIIIIMIMISTIIITLMPPSPFSESRGERAASLPSTTRSADNIQSKLTINGGGDDDDADGNDDGVGDDDVDADADAADDDDDDDDGGDGEFVFRPRVRGLSSHISGGL